MANILIVYGSTEGQTAKIAENLTSQIRSRGHQVELRLGKGLPGDFSVEPFDGVIIGASVHYGRHQHYIEEFVEKFRDSLARRPTAFFSVSGVAGGDRPKDREAANALARKFTEYTQWTPYMSAAFAGAVPYTRYSWPKRMMMRFIVGRSGGDTDTSRDYEYTDWSAVSRFVEQFAGLVEERTRRRA